MAHVSGDVSPGGGLAGAVLAMARGAVQIPWARGVPGTRLVRRLQRAGHQLPLQHQPSEQVEPRGHRYRAVEERPKPTEAHGGLVQRDVHHLPGLASLVREEEQRRLGAPVAGEAEPRLRQVAPRRDAERVRHAHIPAAGRAVGKPDRRRRLCCVSRRDQQPHHQCRR